MANSPMARQRVARWWAGEYGLAGRLAQAALLPAEVLYRAALASSNRAYDSGWLGTSRLPVPVVSVGNLAVGGTGKTPVAAWVAAALRKKGLRPALLHGGYAADEPALHRSWNADIPVFVGRDRVTTGRRAVAGGALSIVLDDGFQHRRLARDVDVVLIAAETWTAEPSLLPRGGWREGPRALSRATLVAVTRKTASAAEAATVARRVESIAGDRPVAVIALEAREWRRPDGSAGLPPGDAFAVAAIARPEAFLANARAAGAVVAGARFFPDHHPYGARDAAAIFRDARNRAIVTTEKDWVKLRDHLDPGQVWLLVQSVEPEVGADALDAALEGLAG
jgi:tetraacyldisaccharide 4'-kinase